MTTGTFDEMGGGGRGCAAPFLGEISVPGICVCLVSLQGLVVKQ